MLINIQSTFQDNIKDIPWHGVGAPMDAEDRPRHPVSFTTAKVDPLHCHGAAYEGVHDLLLDGRVDLAEGSALWDASPLPLQT